MYGSARKSYLQTLDAVHHQGLRLCIGAFRTSPVESLYAEANEPSLCNRRIKLGLQYITKLKALDDNPAYDCVFSPSYEPVYEKHVNKISPFGQRIKKHIDQIDFDLDEISPISIPKSPPWELPQPKMIFDLRVHKKSETNPLIIQQHFAEIKSQFLEYVTSYIDGSKDGGSVASRAILGGEAATLCLPLQASIFTAEARAILLALKLITISNKTKFIICSDSLSCLQSIHNRSIKNRLVYQILYVIKILNTLGKEIVFL